MTAHSRFDPDSGSLRLSTRALHAVAALSGNAPELEETTADELREGGIVVRDELHPRLVPVGRCVAAPLARVRVEHVSPGRWAVDAWVDERIALLTRSVSAGDPLADLVAIPRGMIALNLAKLVALGPRPRVKVDAPVEVDEGLLEAMLGSGETWSPAAIEPVLGERDEVLPEWLEVLSRMANEQKGRWRMGAWWNSAEESPAARLVEVVEADVGSFLVTHRRDPERRFRRARLQPLSATQMWRLLCALVPRPEEVERPLVD